MASIDPSSRGIVSDTSRYFDISGRAARQRQMQQSSVLAGRIALPSLVERADLVAEPLPQVRAMSRRGQLARLKTMLARAYPDVRSEAGKAVAAAIAHLHPGLAGIDPDRTWLDMFRGAAQSRRSYNGWEHRGAPAEAISLTDLQLRNFPADFGGDPTSLDANTGIYTQGPQGRVFNEVNEVRLKTTDVKAAVRAADFYDSYRDKLKDFYGRHDGALKLVAEANILDYVESTRHAARRAVERGVSAERARQMQLSDQALAMLSEAAGYHDHGYAPQRTKTYIFDIDSYRSRDMSWLYAPGNGHVVLIMPNEARPVREYASLDAMREDVAAMARTAAGREQLARHFSIYNRRDGQTYQGVDKWLKDIARGGWNARIAYAPSLVSESVFRNQVDRMCAADLDNVHYLIRSNDEISRQELIQAFGAFNSVLGNPLTQAAELGLDIWEQRSASFEEDRREAVTGAWNSGIGLGLNLLLAGMVGAGAASEPGTGSSASEVRFRAPSRLPDGRTGYALSPMDPPRLPVADGELPSTSGAVSTPSVAAAPEAQVLPPGAVRNSLGLLERRDFRFLYRAVRASTAQLHDPARLGFLSSRWLEVPAMIDEPVVVTSSTKAGAIAFGSGMWGADYAVYQIDAQGLRGVSLEENVNFNARALSRHLGHEEDVVDDWKKRGLAISNVGDGALAYGEVHLSNLELGIERIHRIPDAELESIPSGYDSDGVSTDRELSDDEH